MILQKPHFLEPNRYHNRALRLTFSPYLLNACLTLGGYPRTKPRMSQSETTPLSRIRNFSIIAHIDHGKSTLADRLIQLCGGLTAREMKEQVLDSMDIERERGITIKAQTVRLDYRAKDGQLYELNLIDTPGHVDFAYEVNRSLAACEGSLLVVDATQGVEAQTLANVYQALDNNHEVVPVLNKIDLPAAEPDRVRQQIEDVIGLDAHDALEISAKTGKGVEEVLEAIVHRLPAPKGDAEAPLKALLIDSWYDAYLGVVVLVRIFDGMLHKGQRIRLMLTGGSYQIDRVGIFRPKQEMRDRLGPGEIGFFTASIRQVADTRVGDTVTEEKRPAETPLAGFKPAQPVVFCGLFPVDASEFEDLREAVGKLRLNDASFTYEMETSAALGFGFRCGFLGLLHLEIIRERLEREFNIDLIATAPSVIYRVHLTDGTMMELHNPADMPEPQKIAKIEEPWIEATILVPDEHLGSVLKLCEDRRGRQKNLTYAGSRAMLVYELPLNEVVFDFYDRLKSVSRGYASFDYHIIGYEEGDLVKMALLVNDEPVDALSIIVYRGRAETRGRAMVEKLKDLIPRHLFKIPIQAAIGGKVIARETISAHAQGRDRQMLWRRHHAQTQAARQAEGGKEEDAELRPRRHPARGVHRRAENGRRLASSLTPAAKRVMDPEEFLRVVMPQGSRSRGGPHAPCSDRVTLCLGRRAHARAGRFLAIQGAWRGSGTVSHRDNADAVKCTARFTRGWRRLLLGVVAMRHRDRPLRRVGTRERRGRNPLLRPGEDQGASGTAVIVQHGNHLSVTVTSGTRLGQAQPVEKLCRAPQLSLGNQAGLPALSVRSSAPIGRAGRLAAQSVTSIGAAYIAVTIKFLLAVA